MNNEQLIHEWLYSHPAAALVIAFRAVVPILLNEKGDWIGDDPLPSGADYIDYVVDAMEYAGLYDHVDKLQENGKTY